MVAVDFDNDNDASNNSAHAQYPNLQNNPSYNHEATVYFSAVETGDDSGNGYYFLAYYWYHARDGGSTFDGGHQNDLEGALLIVKKTTYSPFGYLVSVLTQAHGSLIPWRSGLSIPFDPQPVGRNWGAVWFMNDGRVSGLSRPALITASLTHATYAPQDCSDIPGYAGPDGNFGLDYTATQQAGWGTYYYCPHSTDNAMIMYMPALQPGGAGTQQSADVNGGGATYRLVELLQSPLWQHKYDANLLFGGNALSLFGGYTAYDVFRSTDTPGANPPWQWTGQQACAVGLCWYTFGEDGMVGGEARQSLPQSSVSGRFVTAPDLEAALRFSGIPQLTLAMRYNPYLVSPPDYSSGNSQPAALSGSISGPSMVPAGVGNTWSASVSGGTAPYTYQWTGPLSGTSSSISGALYSDDVLYLDVWDSAGGHVAVSYPVTVCQDGQISC